MDEPTTDDLHRLAVETLRGAELLDGVPLIEELTGGVSNDVIVVRAGSAAFVVKRALPRLRVAELWEASADRSFTEAAALRWAATAAPRAVPQVWAVDRDRNVIVIELAPERFANWKVQLLAGDVRPESGGRLGELLAGWHSASTRDAALLAEFDDQQAFAQLRISPFYAASAERNPEVAPIIRGLIERMRSTRSALVHGDFSPKNILVDADDATALWVIDWEVAHTGDPVFDVAFLLHHLVCKAIARPEHRDALADTAERFLATYCEGSRLALGELDEDYLAAHVGALVLARVDGKSPVDYFTPVQRGVARAVGIALLRNEPRNLSEIWGMTDAH
jgi:aminoglycoside phosphotransferase (APT) family kinase protein